MCINVCTLAHPHWMSLHPLCSCLAVGLVNGCVQLNYNRRILTVEFNSLLGPGG